MREKRDCAVMGRIIGIGVNGSMQPWRGGKGHEQEKKNSQEAGFCLLTLKKTNYSFSSHFGLGPGFYSSTFFATVSMQILRKSPAGEAHFNDRSVPDWDGCF
jgi:hypothetical protein